MTFQVIFHIIPQSS